MIPREKEAFTMTELVIVVMVMGILVSIALPSFLRSATVSRARDAKSALSLIQAGQKIYYNRTKTYLSDGSITNINSNLGLDLRESYWDYSANNAPPNNVGTATRGTCTYTISVAGVITGTASCPE